MGSWRCLRAGVLEEGIVLMMMERRGNKSKEPSSSANVVTRLG